MGFWCLTKPKTLRIAGVREGVDIPFGSFLCFLNPYFFEYVKCGKTFYPGICANLIDLNDRARGIFTYGIYDNVEKDRIEDFKNLDQRRISVGLLPWQFQKEIQRLLEEKYGF